MCVFFWNFVQCQKEAHQLGTRCVHCEKRDDSLMAPRTSAHNAVYRDMFK